MSIGHPHPPGVFDAGHCRACACQAGLATLALLTR
jgi:hypothetical protein